MNWIAFTLLLVAIAIHRVALALDALGRTLIVHVVSPEAPQ